jgi:hypothetical protein
MAGRFRIPDALHRADTLAHTGPPGSTRPATTPAKERAHRGIVSARYKAEEVKGPSAAAFSDRSHTTRRAPAYLAMICIAWHAGFTAGVSIGR